MSDGLIGDEFTNRPDDDELAFLHYEKLFREPLEKSLAALQDTEQDRYWNSYSHFMQTYINSVLAMVGELNLDILDYWVNNPHAANEETNFRQIKFDIDAAITKIKVRHAQRVRKGSVHLEDGPREKIREFINKIKLTIEAIDIPLPRKEALMGKLNAFATEVDRDRTRLEAFAALMIEASGVVGKVEKKLRPIRGGLIPLPSYCMRPMRSKTAALACPHPTSALRLRANSLRPRLANCGGRLRRRSPATIWTTKSHCRPCIHNAVAARAALRFTLLGGARHEPSRRDRFRVGRDRTTAATEVTR